MTADLAICCADVGSVRGPNKKFGWADRVLRDDGPPMRTGEGGSDALKAFASVVAGHLAAGTPVALGFECPLFVPVPADPHALGAPRVGEKTAKGARPWSAAAGASVLATGLVQAAWILRYLRENRPEALATFDWAAFSGGRAQLFLWEAFISGEAKAATHWGDAEIAVDHFAAALPDPRSASAVTAEAPLSLIGAAALHANWAFAGDDPLRAPCVVIKA